MSRCGVEFLIYRGDARKRIADFVEAAPVRSGAPATAAFGTSLKGLAEGGEWEEELRASELRKAVILDSALDPIITFDHEGRILEFNAAARRVFGYSRDEVVGREVAEKMVPPSLREELRKRLSEFVETGEDHGDMGRRLESWPPCGRARLASPPSRKPFPGPCSSSASGATAGTASLS